MQSQPGSIEPVSPGWYMVKYAEFGSIEARYYDESGWQIMPGVPSLFGNRDDDAWWDVCDSSKTVPEWASKFYEE